MIPVDIQVSRSKVRVKGHVSLLHPVQLITRERFAPQVSNLVGRESMMIRCSLLIFSSNVGVKGHTSLLHPVQLITQECFAPEASN